MSHEFLNYVSNPTPFHVVRATKNLLADAGFKELIEKDPWTIEPGNNYFVTRNGSSIVAFSVGKNWSPGKGICIIGAHTDSPCLTVKAKSKAETAGYLQVGVSLYGGGLWSTWFDRDLSVAGRVFVKDTDGKIVSRLVKIDRPILRVPALASHLDDKARSTGIIEYNLEKQMHPILGLAENELNEEKTDESSSSDKLSPLNSHHTGLVRAVAEELGVTVSAIEDFELVLYDTCPPAIGGLNRELVYAARMDNLNSCWVSTRALLDTVSAGDQDPDSIQMVALFDHEEVGSKSAQGADSNFLESLLFRISGTEQQTYQTFARSFVISADMAHAVNPNYRDKHHSKHEIFMNQGPVIKINTKQRYMTNTPGIVLLKRAAQACGVPLQAFMVRNDSHCGSTIGPMMAAKLGIRTLDIGNPQLSMHSIRECCGVKDIDYAVSLYRHMFSHYSELEASIVVD